MLDYWWPMNTPLTHYCIVRNDMPLGNICAQLVHAAGESSPGNLPKGTYAVVLQVPNEEALMQIHKQLLQYSIQHKLIREPDLNDQATAIGIIPQERSPTIKKVLRKLYLFS